MKKTFLLAVFSCLMLWAMQTAAQQKNSPVTAKFLLEAGVEYGGDEILKVFFTNGGEQSMKAGQGGYIAVGGQFQLASVKNLLLRTSIGFKYNTTAAKNADISLTRIPINIIPYWQINNDFRVGLGITTHQSVSFKGDGYVSDVDFTSSLGTRAELGYKWIALTYTSIDYKTAFGQKVSASSVGVALSFTFPNK